jgi:endonuclease YncB( thermonuclease family)
VGPVKSAALSYGLERRISSRIFWFPVVGLLGAGAGRTDGEGWFRIGDAVAGACAPEERYLKKLMPVPGIEKDTQRGPAGDLPMRRPPKPQLTPTPREVIVALAPPPRFADLRQRHPIAPHPLFRPIFHHDSRKSSGGAALFRKLSLVLCLAGAPAFALSGTVERVADGDTLRLVAPSGQRTTIRLAGIDAPEKSQPFGRAAGRRLAALCLGKEAEAAFRATDRYGRTVARVFCDGTDAGRTLIEEGLAWHYVQYAKTQPSDEALGDASAEAAARGEKRGLWSDLEPQAPWDYRKARKAGSKRRPLTD